MQQDDFLTYLSVEKSVQVHICKIKDKKQERKVWLAYKWEYRRRTNQYYWRAIEPRNN